MDPDYMRKAMESAYSLTKIPKVDLTQIKSGSQAMAEAIAEANAGNYASNFYNQIGSMIKRFESGLDEDHEVGGRLVSFGSELVFHIISLGFLNPSLLVFHGIMEDGSPVQLIQHVSQISVLLTSLKKPDPNLPARKFGFQPAK